MRAFAIDQFGEPGSVRDLPTPQPAAGEVLVRVRAAAVNAVDTSILAGYLKDFKEHRFPLVPGLDASGVVESVGADVDGYAPGDEVFGIDQKPYFGSGTFAEFVTLPVSAITAKPASIDHAGAAAVPTAALTALSAVEEAELSAGETVLVVGATGGVGSYATLLAGRRGSRVIAVTRGENAEYARDLGAADAIDYTAGDVAESVRAVIPAGAEAILDFSGNQDLVGRLLQLVRPGGKVVSTARGIDPDVLAQRGLRGANVNRAATDRLGELARLLGTGELRVRDGPR